MQCPENLARTSSARQPIHFFVALRCAITSRMRLSLMSICGLEDLEGYRTRGISHVLSILDPDFPEPRAFSNYVPHRRSTLRFHDEVEAQPGHTPPPPEHVAAVLDFVHALTRDAQRGDEVDAPIHWDMVISRA